jgi:hypothetical protein
VKGGRRRGLQDRLPRWNLGNSQFSHNKLQMDTALVSAGSSNRHVTSKNFLVYNKLGALFNGIFPLLNLFSVPYWAKFIKIFFKAHNNNNNNLLFL